MIVRRYTPGDACRLFALIKAEGEGWIYWQGHNRQKYEKLLEECITYLLLEDETLCGYLRVRNDGGFGMYVYDLLVDKVHRGKGYGRLLMERVCQDYPNDTVYVMSDVDGYYTKLGYEKEGSIFIVNETDPYGR